MTFTCTVQLEFKQQDTGSTEVIAIHNHNAVGGTWFNRRDIRRTDQTSEHGAFTELIDRCQAALE